VDNVESNLNDAEIRAWQAFLHAHHQITRKLDAELRSEHELPLNAYDVLLRLARAPGRRLRMSDLAERVMMSPSGLTRVVDRLAADGLVRRERFEGTPGSCWRGSRTRGAWCCDGPRRRICEVSGSTSPAR